MVLASRNIAKVNPLEYARQAQNASTEAYVGPTDSEIVSKSVPHHVVVGTDFDSDESPLSRDFKGSVDREQFTRTSCHVRVSFRDFFYDRSTTLPSNTLLHDDRYPGDFRDGIVRSVYGQGLDPFGHGYDRVRRTFGVEPRRLQSRGTVAGCQHSARDTTVFIAGAAITYQ
jgi:hypothetical protein